MGTLSPILINDDPSWQIITSGFGDRSIRINIFPSFQIYDPTTSIIDMCKSEAIIIQPEDDGFIAKSINYPGAFGQGDTEQEAYEDIQKAIELLNEERYNPSGNVEWPPEYR